MKQLAGDNFEALIAAVEAVDAVEAAGDGRRAQ